MFYENPCIEAVDHWVTVWIGDLDREELRRYLHEPGGALDNEPISEFSRDLGTWYDHDYIWAEAADQPIAVAALAQQNGIEAGSFLEQLLERSGAAEVRALLVLWNARTTREEANLANGRLRCLGSWAEEAPLVD